ncbi:hypothetical protein D3C80_1165560 [compost metagenome]
MFQCRLVPTGAAIEVHALDGRLAIGVGRQNTAVQVLLTGHPQFAVMQARQPTGHADVVGVHMRHQHPARPVVAQGCALAHQRLPGVHGGRRVHAGIENRPTLAIAYGPQVDVRQRQRQRHAQPQHTGHDLFYRARQRGFATGVHQRHARRTAGGSGFSGLFKCGRGLLEILHVVSRPLMVAGQTGSGGA